MALTNPTGHEPPSIPEWTLGERLAKARKDARLEQEHMAKVFDVSSSAISNWENDISQPRRMLDVISRWAAETHVSRGWLLGEHDPPRSRCSDVIDLRVIPGGGKSYETLGQMPLPMLTLLEA